MQSSFVTNVSAPFFTAPCKTARAFVHGSVCFAHACTSCNPFSLMTSLAASIASARAFFRFFHGLKFSCDVPLYKTLCGFGQIYPNPFVCRFRHILLLAPEGAIKNLV